MSEVRRHERQTASGKRTTVRHHTRGGDKGRARREDEAEAAREAWADRNAPHVSSLTPAEDEPQTQEWWAEDDMPPPGAFWADDDEVGDWHGLPAEDEVQHDGHTFKVNRAPAYRPQGDHDFADPSEPAQKSAKELRREAKAAERAEQRAKFEKWEADMKADAERRGLPAYRPIGTKASWWRKRG